MTNRKMAIQGGATSTADDSMLPGAAQVPVEEPLFLAPPPQEAAPPPPTAPATEGEDGDPVEDETEAAVTVEAWARAGGTPVPGREEHMAIPYESLGAFVDVMRAEGKGAARPSYFARRFRKFLREPRD